MTRTDQKVPSEQKQAQQQTRTQEKQRQSQVHEPLLPVQALQVILSGAGLDRLAPQAVLGLSHEIGNSALLEILSRQPAVGLLEAPPKLGPMPDLEPAALDPGRALLISPIDFSGLAPLDSGAAPMNGGEL